MTHSKKLAKPIAFLLGAVFMMICLLPTQVHAAQDAVSAEITVEKKLQISGTAPAKPETFKFILEGADQSTPLPEGGNTATVQGEGKTSFGKIEFSKPGDYYYTVSEENGKAENYTYDATKYQVLVSVAYDETKNDTLTATIYAVKEGATEKSEICFNNTYKAPTTPTKPESPKESGSTPGSKTTSIRAAVKTGDINQIFLWTLILGLSAVSLVAIIRKKKAL